MRTGTHTAFRTVAFALASAVAAAVAVAGLAGAGWAVAPEARAGAAFPYRNGDTIEIVVPFAPGGGFDVYARLLAPFLEEALESMGGINLNVVVRNMPGAGGQIAHRYVYTARPDGKTLMILHGGAVQNYVVLYRLPIDPERFTYLAQIDEFVKGIVVRKNLPVNSFSELVQYSQQRELRVASAGVGDDPHIDPLLIQALLREQGVQWRIRFVHFEGTGPAKAALARGDADLLMTIITTMIDLIRDGDGRLVSVVSARRYERFPNVPTLVEEGVPAARTIVDAMYASHVLAGPPNMNPDLVAVLEEAARRAITGPGFTEAAARAQRDVHYLPGAEAKARVLAKMPKMQEHRELLAQALGL